MPTIDKRFANESYLLPSDLNAIEEDIAKGVELYRHVYMATTRLDAPAAGGPYLIVPGATGSGVPATGATAGLAVFYWNPEWVEEKEPVKRTTYWRLRASCLVNATAPAITFTPGVYAVSAAAGAENALTLTLGSAISGSTVAFTTPAKETLGHAQTEDFAAPAAGFYAIAVAVSGSAAAKSSVAIQAQLQVHNV